MHALSFDFVWNQQSWRVLFADRPEHVSHGSLRETLYDEFQVQLRTSSLLIIREPVAHPLPENFLGEAERQQLLNRNFRLPIHIIGSRKYRHVVSPNLDSGQPSPLETEMHPEFLRQLREYELRFFAEESGALLRATGGLIFRAPSRKYCYSFLRVGTVQKHRTALDAFFFWLVPWLEDCVGIITETWTISSIALNTSRLMARYDPDFRPHCRVDMLAQYHDGSVALTSNALAVLRRVAQPAHGKVLVLISSCMSGRLANKLTQTIENSFLEQDRFRIGTLYSLGPAHEVPALCDLSKGLGEASFDCYDQLPPAAVQKTVIDIDATAYFPLEVVERAVLITKGQNPEAKEAAAFFTTYGNSGLFSAHRDSFDLYNHRTRHRAIFTDVHAILDHRKFSEKFVERLAQLPRPPVLIVAPPHVAGDGMARKAQAYFQARNVDVNIFLHADLAFGPEPSEKERTVRQQLEHMNPDDILLIVDDVLASGASLTRYAESLRTAQFAGGITFLVGLARPESIDAWKVIQQQLRFRQAAAAPYTLEYVEFLILPDWDERYCPWCAETQLYTALFAKHGRMPDILNRRHRQLLRSAGEQGLVNELFLSGAPDAIMTIGDNSIFVPRGSTQAEVFGAVAASIQRLRAGIDTYRLDRNKPETWVPKLERLYPVVYYLASQNYHGTRFTEAVIRSAIIRAATVQELEAPTSIAEAKRAEEVKKLLLREKGPAHDMTLELMLGCAMGKFSALRWEEGDLAVLRKRPYSDAAEILRTATYEPL